MRRFFSHRKSSRSKGTQNGTTLETTLRTNTKSSPPPATKAPNTSNSNSVSSPLISPPTASPRANSPGVAAKPAATPPQASQTTNSGAKSKTAPASQASQPAQRNSQAAKPPSKASTPAPDPAPQTVRPATKAPATGTPQPAQKSQPVAQISSATIDRAPTTAESAPKAAVAEARLSSHKANNTVKAPTAVAPPSSSPNPAPNDSVSVTTPAPEKVEQSPQLSALNIPTPSQAVETGPPDHTILAGAPADSVSSASNSLKTAHSTNSAFTSPEPGSSPSGKGIGSEEKDTYKTSAAMSWTNGHGTAQGNGTVYGNGTSYGNGISYSNGTAHTAEHPDNPHKTESEASGRYPDPPDHGKERLNIEAVMTNFAGLLQHSMRPLPEQTGDGTYIEDEPHASVFKELTSLGIKDVKTLGDLIANGKDPIDDKTMLMERIIQIVAELPDKSVHRDDLSFKFIDQLFTSLQHPPLSYLGDKFKYRQADGSNNNIQYPHIGAANTPYARTVIPETIQPGALPDPGLVFDSVFARKKFRPHPNRNSSVIFYWASIIIHDCFQTDHKDFSNSQTSSYLDLSPLYGDNQDDQDQIRTFKDGMLKADCFSEHRLLTFPPGCGVILIMFNRFHNYVAQQLALINEGGRFTKPRAGLSPDDSAAAWKKYDNDLFQTARLVTGGLYINITLVDYVRTIINLTRSNTTWTLDPRVKMGDTLFQGDGTPRGVGNQVSAEFSLVYRWHSAISEKDDLWTQALFKQMFGKDAHEVSMMDLLAGLGKWEASMDKDPQKRNFDNLKRGPDGKFSDDELVEILTSSIEDCAGAFGANHIPTALKAIDILGMQQARSWNLCSLNEFRKFFGLRVHKTFDDINSDPEVAQQLKNLYETPDRVELYTGLIAESEKMPMSNGNPVGVGICPTYTISRAILSDAVALVRGDRFYTIDFTPANLTNWGYSEVQTDYNVEQGCNLYKLILRAFPNHFKPNSIYAHMPMTIPEENRKIMQSLGRESNYSWDRPTRIPDRIVIQSYGGVKQVLDDAQRFKVINADAFGYLMGKGGRHFMLCGDSKFFSQQKATMSKALYRDEWHRNIKEFYEEITLKLLQEKTCKIAGINQVDITRDVGNLAHIHFAANVFSLPLKDVDHPRGLLSEHEMYLIMAIIFVFLFFDVDPEKSFPLALGAYQATQALGKIVEANVKFVHSTGWISGITDKFLQHRGPLADYGVHMVRHLLASGMSVEEVTWSQILPTAGAMVANQAQVFTQILDFYLSDAGKEHVPDIQSLARQNTDEADEILLHYAMEGIRLNGTFGGYRLAASTTTISDEGFAGQVNVKPGDKVFVSFVKASRDPKIFPDPLKVKPDRPLDAYIHYGTGPHQCVGMHASRVALAAMLKVVMRQKNLRRAPGPQGQLKKIPREDGFYAYMTEDWGKYFPFPTTWKLHFDGEVN